MTGHRKDGELNRKGRNHGGWRHGGGKARGRDPHMQPPRLGHWRSDGTAKVQFRSVEEANRSAFGLRLERGLDLAVYKCDVCGFWHLGGSGGS